MPNGGSARGYQALSAPLASLTTAEHADGQAVFYASATLGVNDRGYRQWYVGSENPVGWCTQWHVEFLKVLRKGHRH